MGIGTSSSSSGASAPRANAYAVNRDASELGRSPAVEGTGLSSAWPDACHLYVSADRLARRTNALHRARVSGQHAGHVITGLAAAALGPGRREAWVADVGCGRGTTTGMLTQRLPAAKVIAIDLSAAMLASARDRIPHAATWFMRTDFCQLPLASQSCDIVVAAFCLYHCVSPGLVIGEIARCLRPGGAAILATKSADSYRELDHLVATAHLDPSALSRPSLYATAHSGNLAGLASAHLHVSQVIHHTHRFTFASLADTAEYLATSPKYDLPASLAADSAAISAAVEARLPEGQSPRHPPSPTSPPPLTRGTRRDPARAVPRTREAVRRHGTAAPGGTELPVAGSHGKPATAAPAPLHQRPGAGLRARQRAARATR